jgi:hypothetical protein
MRRTLSLLVALGLLLACTPLALAQSATVTESYPALLRQIAARQVLIAHVNEERHDIRVTLKNGSEQFVVFPAAQHKRLIDALERHGVKPIYTSHKRAKKPVHHVLRYVAAAIVVVLLLIGAGVWMYTRGQRQPPAVAPGDPPESAAADAPDAPGETPA